VVNQILTEMDAISSLGGVVVMAATNRIDLLDPALLRPGRFGTIISIGLPDERERREIFHIYLKGARFAGKTTEKEITDIMAPLTEGYSGADIQALCQEARLCAARAANFEKAVSLKVEHFKEALSVTKPTSLTIP
jgi:transitional endoplasmic reticulum ATPase